MNKTILIIIIAAILVIGGDFLLRGGYQGPAPGTPKETLAPTGPVKEFTISGTEYSFSPSSITVSTGERVKITFQNSGGAPHNLAIEGLGVSTKTIGSGKTDVVEFTALQSGTFTFFCSVPGHAAAGMVGDMIVN